MNVLDIFLSFNLHGDTIKYRALLQNYNFYDYMSVQSVKFAV